MTTNELEIWKALNELPEVQAVFGNFMPGDLAWDTDCNDTVRVVHMVLTIDPYRIWIPPLFDPIRPERSLWYLSGDIRWNWSESEKLQFMLDARPDLALAKAILAGKEKR